MKLNSTVLQTAHLVLRPEADSDAEEMYRLLGCDAEMSRYTGWNPYTSTEAALEKIQSNRQAEDSCGWVLTRNGAFAGTIGAYDYNVQDNSIEIGYSVVREYWGNGYATEAVRAVVQYLQQELGMTAIRAWSHKDNAASIRVLEHAGFVCTGADGDIQNYVTKTV